MRKKTVWIGLAAAVAALVLVAQESDVLIIIKKGERTSIAVPDLRGSGEAQQYMDAFNQTLWSDLESAGIFKMTPKSLYWLRVPQTPQDFRSMPARGTPGAGRPQATRPTAEGLWLSDWSGPPVNANYLTFGYTGVDGGQIVLRGWLYNVGQPDTASAQVLGKI